MSLDALIMLFGALVAVMPFFGFTVDMQKWIIFVLGLIVITLGIAVRRRGHIKRPVRRRRGEFVESIPTDQHTDPLVGIPIGTVDSIDRHIEDKSGNG
jgi:cytochrome c biogenesis protein CcdA